MNKINGVKALNYLENLKPHIKAKVYLDRSVYDIQEMAKEKGIILSATEEAAEKSGETTEKLVKKLKAAK